MTDKYKYISVSFRKDDMEVVNKLSDKIRPSGAKLSNNKIFRLGVCALIEKLSEGLNKGSFDNDCQILDTREKKTL